MQVTTLIQPAAEVVAIASLKTGDVYKRLVKKYTDQYEMRFGIVRSVVHNGEDVAFTALEFEKGYGDITVELKTFGTASDIAVFPASPDEVRSQFTTMFEAAAKKVDSAQAALAAAISVREEVVSVLDTSLTYTETLKVIA